MLTARTFNELIDISESWRQYLNDGGPLYAFGCSRSLYVDCPIEPETMNGLFQGVFDSDPAKQNSTIQGFKVLAPEKIKNLDGKIVIFADAHQAIARQLQAYGLKEDFDYIRRDDFFILYKYHLQDQLFFSIPLKVDLTTRCSLRCQYCAQKIPYVKDPQDKPLAQLKEEADLLLSHFDQVRVLSLVGGEPFIYRELAEYLSYLGEFLHSQLDLICLTTNGTIVPDQKTLATAAALKVRVVISDYSRAGISGYEQKLARLKTAFDSSGIVYSLVDYAWYDTAKDPTQNLSPEELDRKYANCSNNFRCAVYENSRLYNCPVQINLERYSQSPLWPGALDLREMTPGTAESRQRLLFFAMGHCQGGHMPACQGCVCIHADYSVPLTPLTPGIQLK